MARLAKENLSKSDFIRRHPHLKSSELIAVGKGEDVVLSRQLISAARQRRNRAPCEQAFGCHGIAKLIEVSPSAVREWIDRGYLPGYRTPVGHRRVKRIALRRFLRDHAMPIPSALGSSRVLVIDDENDHLRRAKRLLGKHAPLLTIDTADNSTDALLKLVSFRPDAVLVGAKMPGVKGVDLCCRLQSDPATEHIAVVAMSGRVTRKLESAVVDVGGMGVLAKPLDAAALLEMLGLRGGAVSG